ncbi:MAG: MarR family transcriptional regulator [Alphaproteobacteria bacterium]|nr:MarR family transcriptional regulator [Alphaproteobacteria bacterium]
MSRADTAAPTRAKPREGVPGPERGARAAGLDMGILPSLLGYSLRRAHIAVFQRFGQAFDSFDISPPQYGTLLLVDANPGISQSAIAEALRFDRSTLVQIVDRLERRGLVVRDVAQHDRRSHALRLTDAGVALLAELKAVGAAHEREIAGALGAEERARLIELLAKIPAPASSRS